MVNYNGSLFDESDNFFNHKNRAFRYGDGLFESIRVMKGKMPLFALHYDRILRGMRALKINVPSYINVHYLRHEIEKVVEKMPNARVRLAVWREFGGAYTPTNDNPDFLIEASPLPDAGFVLNDVGLSLGFYSEAFLPQTPFSAFKTSNALTYILAGIFAQKAGFDEVFLSNAHQEIAEAVSSNVFIVNNEKLLTPTLASGCVGGVMRQYLLNSAPKLGREIVETRLTKADLASADAIFLTNAVQGMRWVGQIGEQNYAFEPVEALFLDVNRLINNAV